MRKISDLHGYQLEAVEHIITHDSAGLFLDMGLGKTVSTLTALNRLLYEDFDIKNALVVGPKRVAEEVWTSELEEWEHIKHLKISVVAGNEKKRKAALAEEADIYTISRDNIKWLCGQYGGSYVPFDMLVIDESSSFKNPKSQRFKALRHVLHCFKRVVILTGTPAPNGLIDIWAQIFILDGGQRLSKSVTKFREEYFRPGKRNGPIIYSYDIKDDSEQRIYKRIGDICMSMKAKDYLNLPERIDNFVKISMPSSLKKGYEDFERDQIMELINSGAEITAANAAALSNKLQQYANGAMYDSERNVHDIHELKLDALDEIVEAAQGKPILVAWTFRHDMERIKNKFKHLNPVELKTGDDIRNWNAGKIQMLLMHPASGGHGLNLQSGGSIIVWYGQNWSLELYQQFNARLHRQGQTQSVVIHHLITDGTVDNDIIKALTNKDAKQEGLMSALKRLILKHKKNGLRTV